MTGKDSKGRFTAGNSFSGMGGRARAQRLSPEQLSEIGRKGWAGWVRKYFDGDEGAANEWFTKKGQYASDSIYRDIFPIFEDPGPLVAAHSNR